MSTLTSAQEKPREHVTTAVVNGCPVGVHQAHRIAGQRYGPVLVRVSAPVSLTVEDVTALLYWWVTEARWSEDPMRDLAQDRVVREFLADMVINDGCLSIEHALGTASAGDVDLLGYCRTRAVSVFGPRAQAPVMVGEVSR